MKTKLTHVLALVLIPLFAACATKVENPDNDDDQENQPQPEDDPIVIKPINLRLPELPDLSKVEIDPLYESFFRDTFALIESSHSMLSQLNEFFQIVNDNKLSRAGSIQLEKDGVVLKGKSWHDDTTNGLYFCAGAEKAFYITWAGDQLHVYRDLKAKLPVSSIPMTDELPAKIEATIDNAQGKLGVSYSGIKRDPETVKDTETSIAFHYDAAQAGEAPLTYGGVYAELNAEGAIPETASRRIVGKLGATDGEALAHLDIPLVCDTFDEAATPPAWCVNVTHTPEKIDVQQDGIAERLKNLKDIPTPKRADLKLVEFPADMTCPAE